MCYTTLVSGGRVVCVPARPPAQTTRPPAQTTRPPALPGRPPRPPDKEIFEYIQAYSSIFEVFLKNIQRICPVRPVCS
jgi:hypothetical protein